MGQSWGSVEPAALERGLGGRETAAVRLALEWANLGHDVVTFAANERPVHITSPAGARCQFLDTDFAMAYLQGDAYDAVVSWEAPEIFSIELVGDPVKLCGMQVAHIDRPDLADLADCCVALSPWHQRFLEHQVGPGHRFAVLPNCAAAYDVDEPADKGRPKRYDDTVEMLYASSPDRGLSHLLNAWPRIRRAWPAAQLHVIYGAHDWAEENKWSHNVPGEMSLDILEGLALDGVHDHGRVGQRVAAELHARSDLLAYPFDPLQNTETGCCPAGTPIDCPRDHEAHPDGVPIEQVKPGQLVWTINEETHRYELKPVLKAWMTKPNAPLLKLTLDDGKTIRATPEHPFMLRDGTWRELQDLQPGDSLMPFYRDFEPKVRVSPTGKWVNEYQEVARATFPDVRFGWGEDGMVAHHLDERHVNTAAENLVTLTRPEHRKVHGVDGGWAVVNAKKSPQQREARNRRIIEASAAIWKGLTPAQRSERWHRQRPNHRCRKPCPTCVILYGHLVDPPEVSAIPADVSERSRAIYKSWETRRANKEAGKGKGSGRKRKFDHDEARRLRFEEGWTLRAIAEHLGVSVAGVSHVTGKRYVTSDAFYNHKVVSVDPCGHDAVYNLEVEGNNNYVVNGVILHNCVTVMDALLHRNLPVITDGDCLAEEFAEHTYVVPLPYDEDDYVGELYHGLREDTRAVRRAGRAWVERERQWRIVAPRWISLIEQIRSEKAALTPVSA